MKILTPRQIEFLALSANGKKSTEIGTLCCVSPRTVHNTLMSVRERMSSKTTTQAAMKAIGLGMLSVDANGHVAPIIDS